MAGARVRLKVKEVAQSRGLSQGRLARLADVDPRVLHKIYKYPFSNVETDTLGRIAAALGVDVSELVESDPGPKK